MNVNVPRSTGYARELVIVEIALVDCSSGRGDLTEPRQARSEDCRALELVANIVRSDYGARINRRPNIRNVDLAFAVDFDFHHGRDVGQEAAMSGDAETVSLARSFLGPDRSLGCDLYYPPQAPSVEWVGLRFFRVVAFVL